MSNLERKRKPRATRRRTLGNNFVKINKYIEDKEEISKVVAIRDTVIEKFNQVKVLDEEIFNLLLEADDESLDAEEEGADSFAQNVKFNLNIPNNYINTKEESLSVASSRSTSNVKLPKCPLQIFDGEAKNWQFFI